MQLELMLGSLPPVTRMIEQIYNLDDSILRIPNLEEICPTSLQKMELDKLKAEVTEEVQMQKLEAYMQQLGTIPACKMRIRSWSFVAEGLDGLNDYITHLKNFKE